VKALILALLLLSASTETQEITGVPFVKQEAGYCGPAALASVMAYYGSAIDQKAIGEAVYSKKLKGALITDLESFARVNGFQTNLSQAAWTT
jgi:ABC-type bacteriocin/lantibiotic exporter with double-glycine peptidase domain